MIELLVVIVMIGIVSAIAAPGWLGFLTRQRLNAARTDLQGVLRTAQQEAQSQQRSKIVELSVTDLSVTVKHQSAATGVEIVLGSGETSGRFNLIAPSTSVVFDHDGRVRPEDIFAIKIVDSDSSMQSCVIITTILGGLKPSSGDTCDSFTP